MTSRVPTAVPVGHAVKVSGWHHMPGPGWSGSVYQACGPRVAFDIRPGAAPPGRRQAGEAGPAVNPRLCASRQGSSFLHADPFVPAGSRDQVEIQDVELEAAPGPCGLGRPGRPGIRRVRPPCGIWAWPGRLWGARAFRRLAATARTRSTSVRPHPSWCQPRRLVEKLGRGPPLATELRPAQGLFRSDDRGQEGKS